ncbi:hypothetical protein B0T21DRAFT_300532, partial [Apiosordaria backusii]
LLPPETRRVFGLAGKSPTFLKNIVANPLYQAVCDKMLTSENKSWLGQNLETSISRPQLNNTVVLSISPGARAQELHRDDMIHHNPLTAITADQYKIGRDTGIGWFVAGKKTTKANGATRFIPGSHLWDQMEPPNEDLAFFAELNPGDGFMMLSSCFHGGSANTTADQERLVYSCFMTKGYLRQVSSFSDRKKTSTWRPHSRKSASTTMLICRNSLGTRSATRFGAGWTWMI